MKSFLKTIIFVAAVVAVICFLRNNAGGAIPGIKGWAERTVEHLESLAVTSDEENGTDDEPAPAADENRYAGLPSEKTASSGGAEIISQVGLSSGGGNQQFSDTRVKDYQSGNEFRENSENENMQWVREATARYATTAWTLLMLYDALPSSQEASSADGMVMTPN